MRVRPTGLRIPSLVLVLALAACGSSGSAGPSKGGGSGGHADGGSAGSGGGAGAAGTHAGTGGGAGTAGAHAGSGGAAGAAGAHAGSGGGAGGQAGAGSGGASGTGGAAGKAGATCGTATCDPGGQCCFACISQCAAPGDACPVYIVDPCSQSNADAGAGQACSDKHPACAGGEVCDLDQPGRCAASTVSGTCIMKPVICPDDYVPVCGCDHQTYGNDCERQAAGAQLDHAGACV
jgi:hypothetical protein